MMEYEWDNGKAEANLLKHGIDFRRAEDFQWQTAFIVEDVRFSYGEKRNVVFGYIDQHLHAMTVTERHNKTRIIRLRRASKQERKRYETYQKTKSH